MARSTVRDSGLQIGFDVLRRRMGIGLLTAAAILSLAAPFGVYLPDIYRGTATVIVESSSRQDSPSFVRPSVAELETRLVTIQQEILSRARLIELIHRLNLYPGLRSKLPQEAIVDRMRRDIRLDFAGTDQNRGRATTIAVKISYIGLDPKSAAAVPNALASLYVEQNNRLRERQTGQMAQFLKNQLDAAGREVNRHQERLNAFKGRRAGELPEQATINMMTIERLNAQLRANRDQQQVARERLQRQAGGGAAPAVDPLVAARQRLAELETRFTDRHPDVIQAKAQIADLERKSAADAPARPARTASFENDAELGTLQREERTLRGEIATYEQRLQFAPRHEQELEALETDYRTAKETYGSLLARYEEAQLAESLEQTKKGESIRILDPAIVPTLPAAPNRIRLLLLSAFLALGAGVGAMLLREHLDTSFHSVGELRQFTSIPVLATIPFVPAQTSFGTRALRVGIPAAVVIAVCAMLAVLAYHAARENTQLVWMLAGAQL
jgi:polysaccharide chain length determinant protein (PEP-CTERM system associated)